MAFANSGFFYLLAGFALLLATVIRSYSSAAKSLSLLLVVIGAFNLFADYQHLMGPTLLVTAAAFTLILFGVAYTYFCASVLQPIGFRTCWHITLGAYLPLFYGLLLVGLVIWFLQSGMTERGVHLYIFAVFLACIHLPLVLFTISQSSRSAPSNIPPIATPLIPSWYWFSLALLVAAATLGETRGRKDWILLTLNLLTTGLLTVPFLTLRQTVKRC